MFSQVSVILFRGWVGVSLVMTTSWVCPGEGLGVCPGRELCPEGGGYVQAGRYVQSGVGMSGEWVCPEGFLTLTLRNLVITLKQL